MKPHATSCVASPVGSSRPSSRTGSRPALAARRPREAWITDPNALLAALEHAGQPVEAIRRIESPRPAPALLASAAPVAPAALALAPEPPPSAPALRDDERIGRASDAGVVVIIRRRRAA